MQVVVTDDGDHVRKGKARRPERLKGSHSHQDAKREFHRLARFICNWKGVSVTQKGPIALLSVHLSQVSNSVSELSLVTAALAKVSEEK